MVSTAKLQDKYTSITFKKLNHLRYSWENVSVSIVFYCEMLRNFWTPNNAEHVPRRSLVTLCLVFACPVSVGDPHIYRTGHLAWRNNCHCSCIRRPVVLHSSTAWFILKCLICVLQRRVDRRWCPKAPEAWRLYCLHWRSVVFHKHQD